MSRLLQTSISLKTSEPIQFFNITNQVADAVTKLEVKDGLVIVTSQHTTAAVVINEECAELQKDMAVFLKALVPAGRDYHHDRVAGDGRPNAHSHLLGLTLSHQVTIPLVGGKLHLGTWQKIFFVELDGPRAERRVSIVIQS